MLFVDIIAKDYKKIMFCNFSGNPYFWGSFWSVSKCALFPHLFLSSPNLPHYDSSVVKLHYHYFLSFPQKQTTGKALFTPLSFLPLLVPIRKLFLTLPFSFLPNTGSNCKLVFGADYKVRETPLILSLNVAW